MPNYRLAYMPLATHPGVVPDEAVAKAVAFAIAMKCELHAMTFSVSIAHDYSPIAGLLLHVPEMIRDAEETSRAHCRRLQEMVLGQAGASIEVECSSREVAPGYVGDVAAIQARYFDLALIPWAKDSPVMQELAQAMVFGAGRPTILVPASGEVAPISHVAVAWDGSRVAARALADATSLMTQGTRISVIAIDDDKTLERHDGADALALSLAKRDLRVEVLKLALDGRPIAELLQQTAIDAGANLLVMGGFGHSRIRSFILGSATRGIFSDLRMPVLLSH